MKKKKAFIYVGHSNWGKSEALKQITDRDYRKKLVQIEGKWLFVRKMSNDDQADGLLKFVKKIPDSRHHNFILAYCPNHDRDSTAKSILDELEKSCELYFFVQETKFALSEQKIPESELSYLRKIGSVEVLKGKVKDVDRANAFRTLIENNL